MKNIVTKGTEIIGRHYPISGDKCVIGQVVDVSSNGITFKKVWDSGNKLFYAMLRYNGRVQETIEDEHKPLIGSYCLFHRVGNYNSPGNSGFELYTEDASKSSFLCLVDYFEKEEEPSDEPAFQGEEFSFASWRPTLSSRLAAIPTGPTVRIYTGRFFWPFFYLNTPQNKDFRCFLAKSYTINYYSGYASGVYTGLLFSHSRTYFTHSPSAQDGNTNRVYMYVPRIGVSNKADFVGENWHPYDNPPYVFVEIVEYNDPTKTWTSIVRAFIRLATPYPSDYIQYDHELYDSGKSLDYGLHITDKAVHSNPARTETNFPDLNKDGRWMSEYSLCTAAQGIELQQGTRVEFIVKSRKSGHHGTPVEAWRKWVLALTSPDVKATRVDLYTSSYDTSFNDDAVNYIIGNIGTGGTVPNTGITARYYTTSIIFNIAEERSEVTRNAISWFKWDGSAWVIASVGDTITNITVFDIWAEKSRQSNTVTTSFTLI